MKPEVAKRWAVFMRRMEWQVLKWYVKERDRDEALRVLVQRSNDKNSFAGRMYEYRVLNDANRKPKRKKPAKVEYPEYDEH